MYLYRKTKMWDIFQEFKTTWKKRKLLGIEYENWKYQKVVDRIISYKIVYK